MSDIIRRIERETGVPDLASLLGQKLDPTDLQSLMIQVYRRVAKRRTPSVLLEAFRTSRLFRPSDSNPSRLLEWDRIAFSNLPKGFQGLELSPLAPLGSISSLTPIVQDWIVTTIRNAEIPSDPTNILALECAARRHNLSQVEKTRLSIVNLAASQRVVRSQRFDDERAGAHFRLFSLCSAGRDTGNFQFETSTFTEHVRFYLKCLRLYLGETVPLHVSVFDLAHHEPHRAKTLAVFADELRKNTVNIRVETGNRPEKAKGYYQQVRFHIYATTALGVEVELADGGDVDWTQKLLGNAKERLVISGIGTERVCERFEPAAR